MIEEILPSLYKLEIPLPDSPLKALNSYVIKGRERSLIIDTGWNREECMLAMQAGLACLGIDLRKTDFFITHGHGDHLGLVPCLATETSCIYFNRPDMEWLQDAARWGKFLDFARLNGFPEDELRRRPQGPPEYNLPFSIVKEGDTIIAGEYQFVCIATPGHTRGHLCLYEPGNRVLVAGDHILDEITPNITLWSYGRNPLKEYLSSLDKVSKYDVELVLPGHRALLGDPEKRIGELKSHHEMRAREIFSILGEGPQNGFQVAAKMSWDITYDSWDLFPMTQKWFATGEAIAHLKYLEEQGLIQREMNEDAKSFLFRKGIGT
jgi:glyoxylase-like metal-dependent hydrolase (beta-lactamase superfamily II)